jgi:putative sterol carrier protein
VPSRLEQARSTVVQASEQAAGRVAGALRNAPPERIDQLMRSPARRVVLEAIFWQMPRQLDRRLAASADAAVRWQITGRTGGGEDVFQLEIQDGRCRVIRGEGERTPRLTVTVDGADFVRIATGGADPMRAYFSGQLRLAGDIMAAAKLVSMFRIPGAPRV